MHVQHIYDVCLFFLFFCNSNGLIAQIILLYILMAFGGGIFNRTSRLSVISIKNLSDSMFDRWNLQKKFQNPTSSFLNEDTIFSIGV